MQLRSRVHVLPAEQEAEEVLRGGRLDLAPQPPQREAVDARQERALAPLRLAGALPVAPAQHQAVIFQRRELRLDAGHPELAGQLRRGDGPGDPHPAAHRIEQLGAGALHRAPEAVAQHRPAGRAQLLEPGLPARRLGHGQQHQREEQIVQLIRRAQVRGRLRHHLRDRVPVQRSERRRVPGIERAPQLHGARAALLERSVVQVSVGRRVQDLVRQRRGLRRVARDQPQLAAIDPPEQPAQALDVHRLGQAIPQGLAHQRMVRGLDDADIVLLALGLRGEHLRQQVVRPHAQDVERDLPPAPGAQDRQRAGRVPPPAHAPHRRPQRRLREHLVDGAGREELEDGLQGKAVLRPHRKQHAFVRGRRLQLEIEGAAEPLAQGEPEGAVLPGAEGRVHHQLHPARLVEEPLRDQGALRGQRA